ncbi:hypothetical protein GQX74_004901 [Glossina fuscipes]|nr:hypothetical protein GQX74_004901 [Glossina fuscipes]
MCVVHENIVCYYLSYRHCFLAADAVLMSLFRMSYLLPASRTDKISRRLTTCGKSISFYLKSHRGSCKREFQPNPNIKKLSQKALINNYCQNVEDKRRGMKQYDL